MPERLAPSADADRPNGRLRFELIFASAWLAVGLFLVPAMIFWVGIVLLGPYGEGSGGGLGTFYADFFGDLATGEARTWVLALGPLMLMSLVRAVFLGMGRRSAAEAPTPLPAASPAAPVKGTDSRRVEPKIGD